MDMLAFQKDGSFSSPTKRTIGAVLSVPWSALTLRGVSGIVLVGKETITPLCPCGRFFKSLQMICETQPEKMEEMETENLDTEVPCMPVNDQNVCVITEYLAKSKRIPPLHNTPIEQCTKGKPPPTCFIQREPVMPRTNIPRSDN